MPNYRYKAKKGLDEVVEGTLDAGSRDEVITKLAEQSLFPFSVEEVYSRLDQKRGRVRGRLEMRRRRISQRDVLVFSQKLATLVRAQVELLAGLKILYDQTENTRFKEIIRQMYETTKEGTAFSESLAHFPAVFSPLFVNMVKAGELSGRLDVALQEISLFLDRQESLRRRVGVALAYPALLLFIGTVSIGVLMNFVIPKLRPVFEGLGRELPLVTTIILRLSSISRSSWLWVAAVVGGVCLVLYLKRGSRFFQEAAHGIARRLFLIKRVVENQELALFARSLRLLLNSGVMVLRSLEIATLLVENRRLQEELGQVCREVAKGSSLARSMQDLTGLPVFFTKMVAVGEESGRLNEVLEDISRSYTQQLEADIALISSLLEPLLILVLGVVLGTIVLAILLPTFQITQMVQ